MIFELRTRLSSHSETPEFTRGLAPLAATTALGGLLIDLHISTVADNTSQALSRMPCLQFIIIRFALRSPVFAVEISSRIARLFDLTLECRPLESAEFKKRPLVCR